MTSDESLPKKVVSDFAKAMWGWVLGTAVALVVAGFPIALILTFDSLRSVIEQNTYAVEAVDRQAFSNETYPLLLKSARAQGGTTSVWLPSASWCNQPGAAPPDPRLEQGTAGTMITLRYSRASDAKSVSFDAKGGRFVFVGTQGASPTRICFNENRDRVTIFYDESTTALDVAAPGRVLFIQMDDPGADVASSSLRERTQSYLAIAASVVALFILVLAGFGSLLLINGRKDATFRAESNRRQIDVDKQTSGLHARVAAVDKRMDVLFRRMENMAIEQERKSNALLRQMDSVQNNLTTVFEKNLDELAAASGGAADAKVKATINSLRELGAVGGDRLLEETIINRNKKASKVSKPPVPTKETSKAASVRALMRRSSTENG